MVNWKQVAEDDLIKYNALKAACENNEMKIQLLEAELSGTQSAPLGDCVHAGKVTGDEGINKLIEKVELEELLSKNRKRVEIIERGLVGLDDEERKALDYFYIIRYRNAADRLCEVLNVERTTAYKIRNRALTNYILHAYGII